MGFTYTSKCPSAFKLVAYWKLLAEVLCAGLYIPPQEFCCDYFIVMPSSDTMEDTSWW